MSISYRVITIEPSSSIKWLFTNGHGMFFMVMFLLLSMLRYEL
ncbi:hypothetical protein ACFLUL_00805 [Chloroflexota bacterium]